jgi:hypothetical protein
MKKETFYRKMDDIRRGATRATADLTGTSYRIKAEDDVPVDFKGDIKRKDGVLKAYPTVGHTIKSGLRGTKQIIKLNMAERRSDKDYNVLKAMNESRGEPDFDMNGKPTRGNMARTAAEPIIKRLKKKK